MNPIDRINNYTPSPGADKYTSGESGTISRNIKDAVMLSRDESPGQWTFLIYSSITGDIDGAGEEAFGNLEMAGSGDGVEVVAQRSRNPADNHSWKGVRRYHVNSPASDGSSNSVVLEDMGDLDMSDSRNLEDFIQWGMKQFPARHYGIILGGHGGGFLGAVTDKNRRGMMALPSMERAFGNTEDKTGVKPDLLIFNSCFMASTETAVQFEDSADFMVASQKAEYGAGLPIEEMIRTIRHNSREGRKTSPGESAVALVEASRNTSRQTPAVSAIDLQKIKKVARHLGQMAEALLNTDTPVDIVRSIIAGTTPSHPSPRREPPFTYYRDLRELARTLESSPLIHDENLKDSACSLGEALDEAIIASHQADFDSLPAGEQEMLKQQGIDADNYNYRYGGLSLYAPTESLKEFGSFLENFIMNRYDNLKLARESRWRSFLEKLAHEPASGIKPAGKGGINK